MARLVGWSVVLAGATLQDDAVVVASGGVPGLWQTVARAELTALVSAVTFARQQGTPCRVWSDNQGVVTRAQSIQEGTCRVQSNMADHDLWQVLVELLDGMQQCEFQPIRSHQVIEDQPAWKQWAFMNNNHADAQANRAIAQLGEGILNKQKLLRTFKPAPECGMHCVTISLG